jgi:hypothetical protein
VISHATLGLVIRFVIAVISGIRAREQARGKK